MTTSSSGPDKSDSARAGRVDRIAGADAPRALQRHEPPRRRFCGQTREAMDTMMAEECREWVARVVGDAYGAEVLRQANFVDALRSGVVLHVLLQKLQDPTIADDALQVPGRVRGFYARDNVLSFLRKAASTYQLVEAQLFTDSDLCDGKNDRAVVTCLLSIARIAYVRGGMKFAPSMIVHEQEIDARMKNVTQEQIDDIPLEAENSDVAPKHPDEMRKGEHVDTCQGAACTTFLSPLGACQGAAEEELGAVTKNNVEEKSVGVFTEKKGGKSEMATGEDGAKKVMGAVKKTAQEEATAFDEVQTKFHTRSDVVGEDTQNGKALFVATKTSSVSPSKTLNLVENLSLAVPNALPKVPKYYPRRSDEIDFLLGITANAHYHKHPSSQVRFHRLSSCAGEYVVYHRTAGHRRVVYARILRGQLWIRQTGRFSGGAPTWENPKEWLECYEREFQA